MNEIKPLEEMLGRLAAELGTRPALVERVMRQIEQTPQAFEAPARSNRIRRYLVGVSGLAASLMVATGVLWLVMSQSNTVYARTMRALARVRTVHVTGWTREIVRKWPSAEKPNSTVREANEVTMWFWQAGDGSGCSYEQFGPVIQVRRAELLQEYQADADLLYIERSGNKDRLGRVTHLAQHLAGLKDVTKQQELPTEFDRASRSLRGLRVERSDGTKEEYWFDSETDLPVRRARFRPVDGRLVQVFELTMTYDEPVPPKISSYEPPPAKQVRYGGPHNDAQIAWKQHVQEIGERLAKNPPAGPIALIARPDELFAIQWTLKTPDGKYWVVPLDINHQTPMTLADFIHMQAVRPEAPAGSWRLPQEFHAIELRHDLVCADGTPWLDTVQFVLNHFGLEVASLVEERTLWVAKHDGRQFKPWRDVKPPVERDKQGVVRTGAGFRRSPVTIEILFDDFNMQQDRDLAARRPLIIDETGLPRFNPGSGQNAEDFNVASDSPMFTGEVSLEMARLWYAKEFGITFEEELRPMTVHVVRRKASQESR